MRCNGKPLRTTAAEIVEFFASCGKPLSILNKFGEATSDTDEIKELALISFKKDKAAEKACALSGQSLSGREVVVGINTRPPRPRGAATSSVRVFVGNLPFECTEAEVRAHFKPCGKILFVRWAFDAAGGASKGFCHVIFEERPEEQGRPLKAALALHGSLLRERELSVGPAPPQQKAKRPPKKVPTAAANTTHGAEVDGADGQDGEQRTKKRLRPEDWRHDRKAGLTLPRQKQWSE